MTQPEGNSSDYQVIIFQTVLSLIIPPKGFCNTHLIEWHVRNSRNVIIESKYINIAIWWATSPIGKMLSLGIQIIFLVTFLRILVVFRISDWDFLFVDGCIFLTKELVGLKNSKKSVWSNLSIFFSSQEFKLVVDISLFSSTSYYVWGTLVIVQIFDFWFLADLHVLGSGESKQHKISMVSRCSLVC